MVSDSDIVKLTIHNLISAGCYHSESEVIEDALCRMLRGDPYIRTTLAIHQYISGEISLSKSAEIAGITTLEMKELLKERGYVRNIQIDASETRLKKIQKLL